MGSHFELPPRVTRSMSQSKYQFSRQACDYFLIPFTAANVKCQNLRGLLHELSNDGASGQFEKFLDELILPQMVRDVASSIRISFQFLLFCDSRCCALRAVTENATLWYSSKTIRYGGRPASLLSKTETNAENILLTFHWAHWSRGD